MRTDSVPAGRLAAATLVAVWSCVTLQAEPAPLGKKDSGKSSTVSSQAKFLKKHLKGYLNASKIEFLKGERIKISYEFRRKNSDIEKLFTPPMGHGIKAKFRWTQNDEDFFNGGAGIRISDRGMAMLNCWFTDQIDAQVTIHNHVNHSARMVVALTYTNDKGLALGSNFGTQCAILSKGRVGKRSRTKVSPIPYNAKGILRLTVKDGEFSAFRGAGRTPKATMKYKTKSFASGRVGVVWSGSIAATMTRLEITGKVDMDKMTKVIKKHIGK